MAKELLSLGFNNDITTKIVEDSFHDMVGNPEDGPSPQLTFFGQEADSINDMERILSAIKNNKEKILKKVRDAVRELKKSIIEDDIAITVQNAPGPKDRKSNAEDFNNAAEEYGKTGDKTIVDQWANYVVQSSDV